MPPRVVRDSLLSVDLSLFCACGSGGPKAGFCPDGDPAQASVRPDASDEDALPPALPAPERPHIILIMADDLGYGDVGAYNPDSRIPTPHIDALAAEGVRFTDAHAPGAVCTTSRYGLLTGRSPFRPLPSWNDGLIEQGRETLASLLRAAGYRTAMVGKWHLSFQNGAEPDFGEALVGGPVDHGFDTFFGIPASLDIEPYLYIRDDRAVTPPTEEVDASRGCCQGPFWRGGGIAPGFEHARVLPDLEAEALATIEAQGTEDEPLFLYLALAAPHTPWLPEGEAVGASGAGEYGDFVVAVDAVVGNLMDALREAGMADDALVIFTSDNGPFWLSADRETWGHDAAGGLRGMKGDAWEAGHRVPFVARWPGRIPEGSESSHLLSLTDLMATFATLTGTELPTAAAEDSLDQAAVLLDPDGPAARTTLVVESSGGVLSVRSGDWKLITASGSGGFSDEHEPVDPEAGDAGLAGQLYDLGDDISERRNLYEEHPDRVRELQSLLDATVASGRTRCVTP